MHELLLHHNCNKSFHMPFSTAHAHLLPVELQCRRLVSLYLLWAIGLNRCPILASF